MSDSAEEDDDDDSDSEEKIKAVERHLASKIDTSEFSAAMRSSSDDILIKDESAQSDCDSHELLEIRSPQASSSSSDVVPQQKASRRRQPPQFFGNPIQSTTKGLIGLLQEEGPKSHMVRDDERRANRNLIERAREGEIQRWRDYGVMREVPRNQVPMGFKLFPLFG